MKNAYFRSTHKKLKEVELKAYHLAGDGEDGSYFFIDDVSEEEIGKLDKLRIEHELTKDEPEEFKIQS